MSTLPDLGTNGLLYSIKKLNGGTNPGYRAVDSSADFIAGMVAVLQANSTTGAPEVSVAAGSTDLTGIIGLFNSHKTTSFYQAVTCEEVTFTTSPNTATIGYLKHANLKGTGGAYVIVSSTGDVKPSKDFTYTTDYTINHTNGTIDRTGSAKIGATKTVYVSYFYADPNLIGIDETLGSGLVATFENYGEYAVLVYDTGAVYAINGSLYASDAGFITSTRPGSAVVIGVCTKPPTSDDPSLHFKLLV